MPQTVVVLSSTDNATCIVTGHVAENSKSGLIPLIDLLEIVLQQWDVYEEHRHKDFVALFNKFDAVRPYPFPASSSPVADANCVMYVSWLRPWLQDHDQQLSLEEWESLIKSCDRQKWIADGKSEKDFEWDRPYKIVKKMFKIALHESRLDTDVREGDQGREPTRV